MQLKGKGLLYLIGISVLISIVFIACNKKPTASNDFAEIDKDLPISTDGSGNDTVTSATLSEANNIDSPVVVVSGDKLIIAYGEGNNIKYRTSGDGGKSFSTAIDLSLSAQYPYIFFDGSKVSVMVTKNGGKTGVSTKVISEINGTFQLNNNGAYEISGKSEAGLSGVVGVGGSAAGGVGSVIEAEKYFGKKTTIRTAAGAGIGIGNTRQIPLSEVNGTTYLILEAKLLTAPHSGWGWDLKANSKQTKGNDDVIKIAKDGSIFKTSEIAEKSESYSITANGKITGITSSPTVGNNTKDASIATDGKGNIYTLTIEDGGLKFRKFGTSISSSADGLKK
ncbi:hypothetical protein [Brachyspira sp.]|uniref:hypothetical protein n=1 Tax=Brachyspira sp. TaxID=1977261 RepID=UPI003D7E289A